MTDTAPGTIDPLEDAKAELAAYRILTPADIMADLSPNACLFFLQQAAYAAMSKWGNTLAPSVESGEYEETEVTKAFFGIVSAASSTRPACWSESCLLRHLTSRWRRPMRVPRKPPACPDCKHPKRDHVSWPAVSDMIGPVSAIFFMGWSSGMFATTGPIMSDTAGPTTSLIMAT